MTDYPTPRRSVPAVAFDLDGTLAVDTWPEPHIGDPIPEGIAALEHFFNDGYAIYIYTARPVSHERAIAKWFELLNIGHMIYDIRCGKPIADLYVDDRAWCPPWAAPRRAPATEFSGPVDSRGWQHPEPDPNDPEFDPEEWTVISGE